MLFEAHCTSHRRQLSFGDSQVHQSLVTKHLKYWFQNVIQFRFFSTVAMHSVTQPFANLLPWCFSTDSRCQDKWWHFPSACILIGQMCRRMARFKILEVSLFSQISRMNHPRGITHLLSGESQLYWRMVAKSTLAATELKMRWNHLTFMRWSQSPASAGGSKLQMQRVSQRISSEENSFLVWTTHWKTWRGSPCLSKYGTRNSCQHAQPFKSWNWLWKHEPARNDFSCEQL